MRDTETLEQAPMKFNPKEQWGWQTFALIVVALIVLVFVFTMCGFSGHPANAATLEDTTPTVVHFTAQGVPATAQRTAKFEATTSTTCAGTLWTWSQEWIVQNIFGKGAIAWAFGPREYWCANQGTVRSGGFSNICIDFGGYYVYDGCNRSHSAFGYSVLHVYDVWRYHFDYKLWTDHRTPSVDMYLYPEGGVVGTAYYDN